MLAAAPAYAGSAIVGGHVTVPGAKTGKDVVISLEAPGLKVKPPEKPVEVDQVGMEFVPRVTTVVKGTMVRFLNSDKYRHNVFSPDGKYSLGTWAPGENRGRVFDTPGVFTNLCRLHDKMEAFVIVLNTPYFAKSDAAGTFEIRNVPPGKYTLVAWSDGLAAVKRPIVVTGSKTAADVVFGK
jgi:plastocyanin